MFWGLRIAERRVFFQGNRGREPDPRFRSRHNKQPRAVGGAVCFEGEIGESIDFSRRPVYVLAVKYNSEILGWDGFILAGKKAQGRDDRWAGALPATLTVRLNSGGGVESVRHHFCWFSWRYFEG